MLDMAIKSNFGVICDSLKQWTWAVNVKILVSKERNTITFYCDLLISLGSF